MHESAQGTESAGFLHEARAVFFPGEIALHARAVDEVEIRLCGRRAVPGGDDKIAGTEQTGGGKSYPRGGAGNDENGSGHDVFREKTAEENSAAGFRS